MSYRVLLIDDNQMTLDSMRKTISWEELGVTLVGCAANGEEGCQMILQLRPDIIISDIHMPEMDGLAMLEKMRMELSGTRVIFITAFEKIEYASRAIRLSAFDFLLKPVDNRELEKAMRRAVQSLDVERDEVEKYEKMQTIIRRTRFLSALTAGSMENPGMVLSTFLDKVPNRYFFMVAESENGVMEPLQRMEFVDFPENVEIINAVANRNLVLFCGLQDEGESWQLTARAIANILQQNLVNLTIGVSGLYQDLSLFYTAYQEARFTLMRHDIYGRKAMVEFSDGQKSEAGHGRLVDLDQMCAKLAPRLASVDGEELWKTILKKTNGNLRIIRIFLLLLCSKIMQNKVANFQWTESADVIAYDITRLSNETEARNWLFRFQEEVRRGEQMPTRRSTLVRNVLEYVRSHVTEGLVLEDVAKEFYASPNYLSSIIHKETGITYRQHVINAKIAVAKQMLDDTRMRVEEIAYAVGYENYVSFYNVFKKVERMSPTEYRYRNWKEEQEGTE